MATKKTTTKSRATSAPKKKTAPTKSRALKSKSTRAKKASAPRSFRLEKQTTPFMTTQTSRETLYWVVLGAIVILFTVWVMKLQSDIQAIYDSIDMSNNTVIEVPYTHKDGDKR